MSAVDRVKAVFKKKQKVNEAVDFSSPQSVIKDFVHSKNSTFKGDDKKERIKRALGAYYAHKRKMNEDEINEGRSLGEIAHEIRRDWKNVNYAAKPYLEAMSSLDSIKDNYYEDSGKSIVAYFLSNASSWRGPKAKEIKAELKKMLKEDVNINEVTDTEIMNSQVYKDLVAAAKADRGTRRIKPGTSYKSGNQSFTINKGETIWSVTKRHLESQANQTAVNAAASRKADTLPKPSGTSTQWGGKEKPVISTARAQARSGNESPPVRRATISTAPTTSSRTRTAITHKSSQSDYATSAKTGVPVRHPDYPASFSPANPPAKKGTLTPVKAGSLPAGDVATRNMGDKQGSESILNIPKASTNRGPTPVTKPASSGGYAAIKSTGEKYKEAQNPNPIDPRRGIPGWR